MTTENPVSAASSPDRNFFDTELIAQARQKVEEHKWARERVRQMEERTAWILEKSERELWDFVPPVTQRRALNVAFNVGCPEHGTEVFRRGGHYPWIMSRERPFQVECPVGGEVYPTNDFEPWHHGGCEGEIDTTERFIDDGTGYVGPDGQVYHFVAHYVFWQRWRQDILSRLNDLRDLYLLTGDRRYARAAAVLLARIAKDYPDADYQRQAVHRDFPHDIRGGILDYIWENASVASPVATAYDAIRPSLDDPEVNGWLHRRGIDDIAGLIEDNLLFELVNRVTRGRDGEHENRIWGNFGMYQRTVATLAVVLDNDDPERGLTSDEMVEWIMRPGPWDKYGALQEAFWNRIYRDGHGGEASPAYSAGWARNVSAVAKILAKRDHDLYEHPKMSRLVDVWLDMAVLGKWTPSIGDTGSMFGARRIGWERDILLPAYKARGEPRWARALEITGIRDNELWEDVPLDRIRKDAEDYGEWPSGGTRLLGGYGLAIAESRQAPVGLAMYYGYAGGGHGHRDRLNIEMFALDRPVLPQHGYPTPLGTIEQAPKRYYWTSNTIAQYGVVVNRKWQQTRDRGHLNLLASAPGIQVMDASAEEAAYPGEASLYRRTSMLIENPVGEPFLFDVFRVAGGWEHVWSFHGPPLEEFETFGLDPGSPQEEGTLAGDNVEFGEEPEDERTDVSSGFQFLFNVRRSPPAEGAWGAVWSEPEEDAHVRMTALPFGATEIVVADAEPELRPEHPETIPYLLAFNRAEGSNETRSDFVAVVEAYRGTESVTEMENLPFEGPPHTVAAGMRTGEDQHDILISHREEQDRSRVEAENDAIEFRGELAHLRRNSAGIGVTLINAGELDSPWVGISASGGLRGRISAADYTKNELTLDRRVPGADALIGRTVILGNHRHRTGFQIVDVAEDDGRTILRFGDVPLVVGIGEIEGIDRQGNRLTTRTQFGHLQVDGGEHAGRHLVDYRREKAVRIGAFDGTTFEFAEEERAPFDRFSTEEGTPQNRFWIAESGPGDDWRIPGIVALKISGDEPGLEVELTAPVTIRIPRTDTEFRRPRFLSRDGEWRDLEVSREGEWTAFELSPEDLDRGRTTVRFQGGE